MRVSVIAVLPQKRSGFTALPVLGGSAKEPNTFLPQKDGDLSIAVASDVNADKDSASVD